jgi:IclR family transcriptional regulator, acetate operon repressor
MSESEPIAAVAARNPQTIATVERSLDVLMHFSKARTGTLGVTEISHDLGMAKAAVHRVLSSLRAKGFVELDPVDRRYRLGSSAGTIGLAYLDGLDIRTVAKPALQTLMEQTNETATLSTRSGDVRSYIDQVLPAREVKMTVPLGRPFPLHSGSSSKAFLAFLTDVEIDRYLELPLESLSPATIVDPKRIRADMGEIRNRGFAVSFGERQEGAASVAAPILDRHRRPVGVVSVCGPAERFRAEVDVAAGFLLAATAAISARFGFVQNRDSTTTGST